MENYKCKLCSEISENLVKCLNCQVNFCKKHINSEYTCPFCNCFPFNYKENTEFRNPILDLNYKYKCILCEFIGDKNSFWTHLTENIKKQ